MFEVVGFYKFFEVEDTSKLKEAITALNAEFNILGTVLVAEEGVNGTVCGSPTEATQWRNRLESLLSQKLSFKISHSDEPVFRRTLVKIKPEIVTMRKDHAKPLEVTGNYLDPKEFLRWQENDEDFVVLDTRNDYEYEAGTFRGAINPDISQFTDFPAWVEAHKSELEGKKVVTFCTGGIRCEKATSHMKQLGIDEVYQLEGGILNYFEKTKESGKAYWSGDCVVFDRRLAVTPDLKPVPDEYCCICLYKLTEDNAAEDLNHGRRQCVSCQKEIAAAHEERFRKGQETYRRNFARRQVHILAEREKHQQQSSQ